MKHTLKLSISNECFEKKDDVNIKKLRFVRSLVDIDEFEDYIKKGYCFCHWFNTPNNEFGMSEKNNNTFECANTVFVDVDDYNIDMTTFVGNLELKPTIAYTTPSNGLKGYRFRLVYLFNEDIKKPESMSIAYNGIIDSIRNSYPDYPDKDSCGARVAQYMNGNGTENCEICRFDNVYNFVDIGINDINITSQCIASQRRIHSKDNGVKRDSYFTDEQFMNDFYSMQPSDLLLKYSEKYPFFQNSTLDYNENGYALIDDDYHEIRRICYIDKYTDDRGIEHVERRIKKRRDGDSRRYYIFLSALIRKQILPDITFEHLLYNLVAERQWFYNNSDNVLNNEFLIDKAITVINTPNDRITLNYCSRPSYKIDKDYCRRNQINPISHSNKVRGMLNTQKIGELYDCSLSVSDNLKLLNDNGIKVGKTTLYKFCKENEIQTNPKRAKSKNN